MLWNTKLSNLRSILSALYLSPQESIRVVEDAGLNPAQIAFDNKAVTTWHNILREAQKHHKVDAIVEVALINYPENELLRLASEGKLTTVSGPDFGEQIKWQGEVGVGQLEKIIGKQNTLLPISYLEAGLLKARSVARIMLADGSSGTGFLTTDNLLITNNHVLPNPEQAAKAVAQFNYQQSMTGLDEKITTIPLAPEMLFSTSEDDDWTVVKVEGNANIKWGSLKLQPIQIQKEDRVTIIQHPGGGPKQIAFHHNLVAYVNKTRVQYLTDSLPGSSGSPVFDASWNVVALHHSGGWLREPDSKHSYFRNEGIHINAVIEGLAQIL